MARIKTLFFDAAGTLFYPTESVGATYARFAKAHQLQVDREPLDRRFGRAFKTRRSPTYPSTSTMTERETIDRQWWKALVADCFFERQPSPTNSKIFESCFSDIYNFYGKKEAWTLFDDVLPVLNRLKGSYQLCLLSNFDTRLHQVIQELGIDRYFDHVWTSSELGFCKPHPTVFELAVKGSNTHESECLHIGDDQRADWEGAKGAGLKIFPLSRPEMGLEKLAFRLRDFS